MDGEYYGEIVKVYHKFAIFPAPEPEGEKEYVEETFNVHSRGLLLSLTTYEGILKNRTRTLARYQNWNFTTKFDPIVAPK